MTRLIWWAGLRYWIRNPLQLVLAILSITLGVAVVVAVQLANESALKGFTLASQALGGSSNYRLVGGTTGVPQHWYTALRLRMGIEEAAPRVEGLMRVAGHNMQLLGIAPLAEMTLSPRLSASLPGAGIGLMASHHGVMMTRASAVSLGLIPGKTFSVRVRGHRRILRLRGYLEGEETPVLKGIVITDIATAQALLGQTQYLSSIALRLDPSQKRRLSALLPPGLQLLPTGEARVQATRLTHAFRLNLTAMSLLALLIGAYLVYNAVVFSVLRRGHLISLLRAQGVTASEIWRGIMTEVALLSLMGTLLGLMAGVALGYELIGLVTRTINDLYFRLAVSHVYLDAWILLKGGLLSIGIALAAAVPAALEATALPPRGQRLPMTTERRMLYREPRRLMGGLLIFILGLILMEGTRRALLPAFAALFLLLLGYSLWLPTWLRLFVNLLSLFGTNAGVRTRLALTTLRRSVSRTGLSVTALTIALAAAIGVGVMVSSFRQTVTDWLHQTLRGDYYVAVQDGGPDARLSPALIAAISHLPGVASITTGLHVRARGPDGRFTLLVLDSTPGFHPAASFREALPHAWSAFEAGQVIFVSEPLAYRKGLHPGGRLKIDTPAGPRALRIAAIIRDYGGRNDLIMMPRRLYRRWWPNAGVSSVAIYQRKGVAHPALLSRLRALVARSGARVRPNKALIDQSLRIFDQTFAITRVLRLFLIGVAFVGILASLMALVLEREREHAMLRALGSTPFDLLQIVSVQTLILGLAAGLAAWPLGAGLAWVLTEVINRRAFGWMLPLHLHLGFFIEGLIMALCAAFLAGLYPSWRITHVSPSQALRSE